MTVKDILTFEGQIQAARPSERQSKDIQRTVKEQPSVYTHRQDSIQPAQPMSCRKCKDSQRDRPANIRKKINGVKLVRETKPQTVVKKSRALR